MTTPTEAAQIHDAPDWLEPLVTDVPTLSSEQTERLRSAWAAGRKEAASRAGREVAEPTAPVMGEVA